MNKYKVGKKVRVRKDLVVDGLYGDWGFALGMMPMLGKIVEIENVYGDGTCRIKEFGYVWTHEMFESLEQSIHIYTDGATTTAILREGKKTVKKALAKCNPNDEFDFKIGASLALDRLFGKEPEQPTEQHKVREVKRRAKVGEWIKIVDGSGCSRTKVGDIARVTTLWGGYICPDGVDYITTEGVEGTGWHCRYVVLEGYKPPTFDWEAFETQKIAVHCDTEEKAKAFLKECHNRGLTWCGGRDLLNHRNWDVYHGETCYTSKVSFGPKSYFEERGDTIIPCPVTAEPEPPTYYNGKVVCVATNSGVYHTVGKIYECKDGFLDSDIGKGRHNYIPYKSFEALQYHALPKFVELVED